MNSDLKQTKLTFLSASNVLIAANIGVMAFCAVKNPGMLAFPSRQTLIEMGANYGVLTFSGESWRLLSSMFLHVGVIHLIMNLWGLRCVGPTAESLFGWRMFLLIYFFSGVIGALTSIFHSPLNVSAGASGAILGVYGSLLAFMYVHREKYSRGMLKYHAAMAVGLFTAMIVFGRFESGIDNYAHFGGFIAGGIAGLILARLDVTEEFRAAYAIPIMLFMLVLWAGVIEENFKRRAFFDYAAGVKALNKNEYVKAVNSFTIFIEHDSTDPDAFKARAMAYSKTDQLDSAVKDYSKVLELSPQSVLAYNNRAWAECGLGKYDRAILDATTALKLDPKFAPMYDTRGYAYAQTGQTEKALSDFAAALQYAPSDAGCHYHRMKLYESLGKTADAGKDRQAADGYHPETWER
ncbi:MAG TPA: rhomboid family intramembrane serine protease [Candidatus Obscuribacterales bacterium]